MKVGVNLKEIYQKEGLEALGFRLFKDALDDGIDGLSQPGFVLGLINNDKHAVIIPIRFTNDQEKESFKTKVTGTLLAFQADKYVVAMESFLAIESIKGPRDPRRPSERPDSLDALVVIAINGSNRSMSSYHFTERKIGEIIRQLKGDEKVVGGDFMNFIPGIPDPKKVEEVSDEFMAVQMMAQASKFAFVVQLDKEE